MLNRRPKKTKFLKYQKGRLNYNLPIKEENKKENQKDLKYVLIACEPYRLTASHIYAGELAIKRSLKKAIESGDAARWNIRGKLEIKVFPHIPVTKKPAEVRMGKGKGSIDYWMTRIKVGSPIFELNFQNKKNTNKSIENRCYNIAKSALKIASSKLPIKTNIVSNI